MQLTTQSAYEFCCSSSSASLLPVSLSTGRAQQAA